MEIMDRQANLLEVICARHPAGCFSGGFERREKKGDQLSKYCHPQKKFKKGKSLPLAPPPPFNISTSFHNNSPKKVTNKKVKRPTHTTAINTAFAFTRCFAY